MTCPARANRSPARPWTARPGCGLPATARAFSRGNATYPAAAAQGGRTTPRHGSDRNCTPRRRSARWSGTSTGGSLEWRRIPDGPPICLRLVNEEAMVARWRAPRPRPAAPAPPGRRPDRPAAARGGGVAGGAGIARSQACQDDGLELVVAQRDGVALHAARPPGLGGDVVGLLRAEAERGQPGHGRAGPGSRRIQARPSSIAAPGSPVSSRAASAYRSRARVSRRSGRAAPRTFASMTGASSAAQAMPCGTSAVPPMTPARPCTAPSLALASAIPPSSGARGHVRRGPPGRRRRRRRRAGPAAARRSPSRASPSVSGVARGETNGSRHWVSASRPLAAVTAGGQTR